MMKKILILLALSLILPMATHASENGLISVKSKFNVYHTVDRFIGIAQKKGMKIIKHVKHSSSAKKVNISLRPTELIIFGNPKVGAPMMKCSPTIAIDLPQKLLVWQDENEQTWMTYNNPIYIADRHKLADDCRGSLNKIANALANFTKAASGLN